MIGLRADMDALPLTEHNECTWKSGTPGLMHGCGHDGHTAMLMGAARYLAETRRFDGTAVLIFQPGEEGYAGARAMMQDGLFERFPCEQVYAQHNSPETPLGVIGITPGPMQAAVDRIEIRIIGKGGHGARPHQAVDPVLVAGHIITAAQSVVSRNLSAFDQAVISICSMQAGHPGAMSVIPGEAVLVGTVRTYSERVQDQIEDRLRALCNGVAQGFGASAELTYERVYPRHREHRARSTFRLRRGGGFGRRRQGVARHAAQHGRRRFFFHAPGQARGVHPHRPRFATRPRPASAAQQPLRLQRRHPALGRGLACQPDRAGFATERCLEQFLIFSTAFTDHFQEFLCTSFPSNAR